MSQSASSPSPRRELKVKLALAAMSVTLTAVALVVLLQLLGVNVAWQLWYLASGLFGPTRIGIWQPDPEFGWVHIPNSTGRHHKPLVYDVTYHIDAEGHRVTSGSYSLPKVLILGDSFTFGQGVEDSSPYPEVLQGSFPDYKIINGGVSAWGTVQAYLELKQQLASHDDIQAVVYAFIDADLERNYLRRTWLEHISKSRGLRVPYFDDSNGQLVFKGLADPAIDGLDDGAYLSEKEETLTRLLLANMKALCTERSIPFIVVHLPDTPSTDFDAQIASIVGNDSYVDLRKEIDYAKIHLRFDGHPSQEGHRQIAEALKPILNRVLN